jgi:hypothetical protein
VAAISAIAKDPGGAAVALLKALVPRGELAELSGGAR